MKKIHHFDDLQDLTVSKTLQHLLRRLLQQELEISGNFYNPESTGYIYLMEESDKDAEFIQTFGQSLDSLKFEAVHKIYNPSCFLAYQVRNNSRCDSLIIPIHESFPEDLRVWLDQQC